MKVESNKEKIINYKVIYDSEGNPTIKLSNRVKVNSKQMNHMLAMSRLQYPILLDNHKKRLIETLQEASEFFDENSSKGFWGRGEPKLEGLIKEEYLQKEQNDFLKDNKQISMDCTTVIKAPINFKDLNEKEAQKLNKLMKDGPVMNYDKEGNVSLSKPIKLHTDVYEGVEKVDEYDSALTEDGLLGETKKKQK